MAVCQDVLEGLSRQVPGGTPENAVVDRQVAPKIDPPIHTECIDNFESYGYQKQLVADAATGVVGRLNGAGLPTHDVFVT